jgi:hypothetical protein
VDIIAVQHHMELAGIVHPAIIIIAIMAAMDMILIMVLLIIAHMLQELWYHAIPTALQPAPVHGVTLHALLDAGIGMGILIDGSHGVLLTHI